MRAVLLIVVTLASALAVPATSAGAHATVVGTEPADGTVVDSPPDEYIIHLDAKPGTVEGDPIRIYSPTGTRVDTGDVRTLDGRTALAVTLSPDALLPEGEYQVVYRVISQDTHLIAGRFSFRSRAPADSSGLASALRKPAGHELADTCTVGCQNWPQVAAAAGAVLLATALGIQRWLRLRRENALRAAAATAAAARHRARRHHRVQHQRWR